MSTPEPEKQDFLPLLNNFNDIATLILKLTMTLGFLALCSYIYSIHWMPIGISLSETGSILVLGVCLAFVFLFILVLPTLILIRIFRSIELKEYQIYLILCVILSLIINLFISNILEWDLENINKLGMGLIAIYFIAYIANGFLLYCYLTENIPIQNKKYIY